MTDDNDERITPAMGVVRDLTEEEYNSTYQDGYPHFLPDDLVRYLEDAPHNTQGARLAAKSSDLSLPFLPAAAHGGPFKNICHIRVIHCTEGPMSRGNARALAGPNWFGGPAGTSAHDIFDPGDGVAMVPAGTIAYHVGPAGNGRTRGTEHCGRVSFTRAQWTTADGMEMLTRSARYNAAAAHRDGVLPRWLTLTQLARGESGFCTHNDIRLALGGTTHSDPGPNFPYDIYMNLVTQFYNGQTPEDPMAKLDDDDRKWISTQLQAAVWAIMKSGANSTFKGLPNGEVGAIQQVEDKVDTIIDLVQPKPDPVPPTI